MLVHATGIVPTGKLMSYYFLKKFNVCVRFGHASNIYSRITSVESYMIYYLSIAPFKYL